jgi:Bacterial protein of unknown function (DUF885)
MTGATRRTLDAILDAMLDAFPSQGRDLGLRTYEGRVDDLSPAGLRRRAAERRRHLQTLASLPATGEQEAADRDQLALVLAEEELLLGRREPAQQDPLWAGRVLVVTSYLEGPPGTEAERADGLRRHLEQVPDALDGLAAGLEEVPLAFREAAGDVFGGYASFYRTEVAADFAELVRVRTGTALGRPSCWPEAGPRPTGSWPPSGRRPPGPAAPRPRSGPGRPSAPRPPASCWPRPPPRWPSAAGSWPTAASCPCPPTSRPGSRRPRRTCAAPSPSTTPRGRSTRGRPRASATT